MRVQAHCVFLVFLLGSDAKEKIWRYSADISDRNNWIDEQFAQNCKGIHFAPINSFPIPIEHLETSEVDLPVDGQIEILNNGGIEFRDNGKCIKLKPINYHEWYDPESWYPTENSAIPSKHQIPCSTDDVIMPKYPTFASNQSFILEYKTMKLSAPLPETLKKGYKLGLDHVKCDDSYGCLCHVWAIPWCLQRNHKEKLKCLSSILPEESCKRICGAYVTYKTGPKLKDLQEKLKSYTVDSYASRVKDFLGNRVMQVVFSEKDFTGKSLEEFEDFILFLKSAGATDMAVFKSGNVHVEGGSTVGLIFGTLGIVIVFFGVVFLMDRSTTIDSLVNRLNISRASAFSVPFLARFDPTAENLIVDNQSETESVLDKSFENPTYASASTEHSNPLYDVEQESEE